MSAESTSYQQLVKVLVEKIGYAEADLNPDVSLADLELDSLGAIEVVSILEEELGISIDEAKLSGDRTLGEIAALLDQHLSAS